MLTNKQKKHLKGLAHDKKPVVMLGKKGLTDSVVKETQAALLAHELIKVKLLDSDDQEQDVASLAERADAELVGVHGHIAILYAPHPDKPRIRLPKA